MATYNGERFLKEQIDSLFVQTFRDWHLYVHDDGSTDGTIKILNDYSERYPDKITLLNYSPQGGPCMNFMSMLSCINADYYMFCDQDDVWLPEKIELSVKEMAIRELETPEVGIVVCSDLFVVDEQLSITTHSMWKYLSIYPQYIKTFRDSGASSIATGCTMLFNHQAKEDSLPCSPAAIMHDCWVCLCTLKQHGKLYGISKQLVLYRQHDNNSLGVGVSSSKVDLFYRIRNFLKLYKYNISYYKMLTALDYGSFFKYLIAKIRYRQRIKRGSY